LDIRRFNLNLLRVLAAVLAESQVSSAARRLNLSQPATSAALTQIRNALGDPILVRDGAGMVLSPFAEQLRPKVQRLLAEIEVTLTAPGVFAAANSQRNFQILSNDYAVAVVLSPLLELLRREAPLVTVEILPLEDHCVERLAGDAYDLAIRDAWSLRSARSFRTLFAEDYVCIARRDHPRLSAQPTLDEFLAEGHVLISPRGRVPGAVDAPLRRMKRKRRVAITLPHFLAGPAVVVRTDFLMTIPRRIAHQYSGLYALRIFPPPLRVRGFEVAIAWPPRKAGDPAVAWLRDRVQSLHSTDRQTHD